MDCMPDWGSPKDKTFQSLLWALLTLLTFSYLCECNPHQPQAYNWELIRSETGVLISSNHTPFQPTFQVDHCDILGKADDTGCPYVVVAGSSTGRSSIPWIGCGNTLWGKNLQHVQLYMSPQTNSCSCFGVG